MLSPYVSSNILLLSVVIEIIYYYPVIYDNIINPSHLMDINTISFDNYVIHALLPPFELQGNEFQT